MTNMNLYEQMFKQNKIPVIIFNPDNGIIIETNSAFNNFFEFTQEEIKKLNILDLVVTDNEFVTNIIHDSDYTLPKTFRFIGIKKSKQKFTTLGAINYLDIDDTLLLSLMVFPNNDEIIVSDYNANIFEDIPSAICIIDSSLKVLSVNKQFTKLFGWTIDEIQFKRVSNFIASEEYQPEIEEHNDKILSGEVINKDTIRITKDKREFNCNIFAIPYLFNGKVVGTQIFYTDITREVENQNELRMFRRIIENNSDGVIITDANKNIIWVNKAFTEITEYTKSQAIGSNPRILQSGLHDKQFYDEFWSSINNKGNYQGEIWNRKRSGVIYPQWINVISIKDQSGKITNYVSLFKSLDEIDSINKKFLMMIQKDSLTALYNRTYFIEKVKKLLTNNIEKFYLLFIDIDNFKLINDGFGHKTGDELLVTFAKTLVETFKGQIISRYGGDEFVIFIKDEISKENLIHLIDSINRYVMINNHKHEIVCSVGIVEFPTDAFSTEDLINKADKAMYAAKNKKSIYSFYSELE